MTETVQTTVKLNKKTHQKIKIYCAKSEKNMNEFYEEALERHIKDADVEKTEERI